MLYAIGPDGSKAVAVKGLQGTCPGCESALIAKCGKIKCHHWAHRAGDCDPWYEPESAWHVGWKNLGSPDRDLMKRFGLARCRTCRRIMLARHLDRGRCRGLEECITAFWVSEPEIEAPAEEQSDTEG